MSNSGDGGECGDFRCWKCNKLLMRGIVPTFTGSTSGDLVGAWCPRCKERRVVRGPDAPPLDIEHELRRYERD